MRRLSLLFAACLAAQAAAAFAQVGAGEISGLLKDQAGAPVAGATVTIIEVSTNRRRVVSSGVEGMYTAPSLAPGDYRIDVELTGTLTRGMTIADWSKHWGREPNALIGVGVDPAAFFDRFIARVGAFALRLG